MDFGPIITQNGCIRFIYSEEYKFLSGRLGYDSCSYELMLKKDNEKIVCEYDMETLKQIPKLKNEVKDGIMTLQYREYGFKLNIKFKVDPLMYFPQLSKNKNAVILQTKHINNLENITTFNISAARGPIVLQRILFLIVAKFCRICRIHFRVSGP
jgi:hypothetical protein